MEQAPDGFVLHDFPSFMARSAVTLSLRRPERSRRIEGRCATSQSRFCPPNWVRFVNLKSFVVTPAPTLSPRSRHSWFPACAGMTGARPGIGAQDCRRQRTRLDSGRRRNDILGAQFINKGCGVGKRGELVVVLSKKMSGFSVAGAPSEPRSTRTSSTREARQVTRPAKAGRKT